VSDNGRTDADLLSATAGGDDDAFTVLVLRYIRPATLLCIQLLGDRDDAEDVVQDSFTVIYKKAAAFDAGRPFAPWFFSIVRRLASNRRSRDLRRERLMRLFAARRSADSSLMPTAETDLARAHAELPKHALEALSPMQRACFDLVVVRGLSVDQVATMHDISESTVRQHVFRARASLRKALENPGDG
jgi:RNA polymerase sigma-70 factor (ECF subfamily)